MTLRLYEQHPDWPIIFASECVRMNLSALVLRLYQDLAEGIEYRLVG